jgi:hypothetical protein
MSSNRGEGVRHIAVRLFDLRVDPTLYAQSSHRG